MQEYITVEYAYSYGVSIQTARRLTADEREQYTDEAAATMLVGIGDELQLDKISWEDMPKRATDGEFAGCANRAWIITEDERDALIALNDKREREADVADRAAEIDRLDRIIADCEAQPNLPSREEARLLMREYNNVYNEGGEGYVPHVYSVEDYQKAKSAMERMIASADGRKAIPRHI